MLGMLTALGGCEPQLEVHINASLNVGLTPQQITEAFLHAAVYCGFPPGSERHLHRQEGVRGSRTAARRMMPRISARQSP